LPVRESDIVKFGTERTIATVMQEFGSMDESDKFLDP
jgi:hypothetical protein